MCCCLFVCLAVSPSRHRRMCYSFCLCVLLFGFEPNGIEVRVDACLRVNVLRSMSQTWKRGRERGRGVIQRRERARKGEWREYPKKRTNKPRQRKSRTGGELHGKRMSMVRFVLRTDEGQGVGYEKTAWCVERTSESEQPHKIGEAWRQQ